MSNPTPSPVLTSSTNEVTLLGYYGGDESHAMSAWTSTRRDLSQERIDRIPEFLRMLAENGHHTPFEKSSLHFLVKAEVASRIHMLKHRIGVSINEESPRYKRLREPSYYIPADWSEESKNQARSLYQQSDLAYREILTREETRLGLKRAKESSRFCLPYGVQTTGDVMFNFRSFMHFCGLRVDEHAQVEIRNIGRNMLGLILEIPGNPFRHSIDAFRPTALKGF
jgi:thymidylate synthase (FAD)